MCHYPETFTQTLFTRKQYCKIPQGTPLYCDRCNARFSTTPALACKVGGLIHSHHDEIRASLGCLACAEFQPSNVRDEHQINLCRDIERKDESNKMMESNLGIVNELDFDRGDLLIRSFWNRSIVFIIDSICDVNQPSYLTRKLVSIVKITAKEKKRKNLEPYLEQRS